MKYGMRERLSGAVILIALAVIFVPMLFDEPAPRSERPQPVLTIEQPVEVERREVPEPRPPASLEAEAGPVATDETAAEVQVTPVGGLVALPTAPEPAVAPQADPAATPEVAAEPAREVVETPAAPPAEDPIAALARAAEQRLAQERRQPPPQPAPAAGEWAVQVGSFGESANAERLLAQLREQGFAAYSRPRDDRLTTVYVGPFESAEEGERAMAEIKARINLQGLLVRVRN